MKVLQIQESSSRTQIVNATDFAHKSNDYSRAGVAAIDGRRAKAFCQKMYNPRLPVKSLHATVVK
jgi:hypothetical protein